MMIKKGWMGVMILSLLFCFVVGVASAADFDVREVEHEVKILYELNKLGLSGDQLDQIIATLKEVEVIYITACDVYESLLLQEKDLLLAGKVEEAEAIQAQKTVVQEKAKLDAMSKLVGLQLILTLEQKELLGPIGFGFFNAQNVSPSQRFPMRNVSLKRVDQLDFQIPRAIKDKWQQVIEKRATLDKELNSAEGTEREEIIAELQDVNSLINQVKNQIQDIALNLQNRIMGKRGNGNGAGRVQRPGLAGISFLHNLDKLPLLIQLLEEMRAVL